MSLLAISAQLGIAIGKPMDNGLLLSATEISWSTGVSASKKTDVAKSY